MSLIFAKVVNMSISAGILILAVILVRFLFRKLPRKMFLIAWMLVMIRLVCPFTISNALSPVPADFFSGNVSGTETAGETEWQGNVPDHSDIPADKERPESTEPESALDTGKLFCIIWAAGAAVILAVAAVRTGRLRKTVGDAEHYQENIFVCADIKTSFVLGILRPRIYVPSAIGEEQRSYIIDHEEEHIKYRDHLLKLLFYIILAVHWFDPLVHIAYHLFSEDLEMACDERTVEGRDSQYRADYLQTLLDCGISSSIMSFGTLSFGSIGIKRRIERIMNYKKTKSITIAVFTVVCLALVFFLMTNNAVEAKDSIDPNEHGGTRVVIRDASGTVVESYNLGDSGLDATVPSTDFPEYDPVSGEDREKYGGLQQIREETLKEGVYRSSEEYGDPIYAVCEGEVISSERDGGYGLCVTIRDDNGRIWKYGHCSELVAKTGDYVSFGDHIAYIGMTGLIEKPGVIIRIVQ